MGRRFGMRGIINFLSPVLTSPCAAIDDPVTYGQVDRPPLQRLYGIGGPMRCGGAHRGLLCIRMAYASYVIEVMKVFLIVYWRSQTLLENGSKWVSMAIFDWQKAVSAVRPANV